MYVVQTGLTLNGTNEIVGIASITIKQTASEGRLYEPNT
jgi:hypothetical protein